MLQGGPVKLTGTELDCVAVSAVVEIVSHVVLSGTDGLFLINNLSKKK